MEKQLLEHIKDIHTTELGEQRIKRNMQFKDIDVVEWCKETVCKKDSVITRKGKNYYIETPDCIITINAYSYTIITVHKKTEL